MIHELILLLYHLAAILSPNGNNLSASLAGRTLEKSFGTLQLLYIIRRIEVSFVVMDPVDRTMGHVMSRPSGWAHSRIAGLSLGGVVKALGA